MRRLGQRGKYLSVGLQGVSGSAEVLRGGLLGLRFVAKGDIGVEGVWQVYNLALGPVWCLGSLTLMSVGFGCWLAGG